MGETWTSRRVLEWAARDFAARGLPCARLDAELLLADALGCDRVHLYMDLDRPLSEGELAGVRERVRRRRAREPVAYILGAREFFGRRFAVGPAVLVPRPETELLVERALARLRAEAQLRVLELCTGSGAVAATLAAERPAWRVDATDISSAALEVACANLRTLGLSERVRLHEGDLFDALGPGAPGDYDLIVANPPYIAAAELEGLAPDVRDHEPRLALVGGEDGLDVVRRILVGASAWLRPGGGLLVEVGAGQAAATMSVLGTEAGWRDVGVAKDLARVDRVVEATWGPPPRGGPPIPTAEGRGL